jgi:ankyrin repeat protein
MFAAVKSGDVATINRLVQQGAPVNASYSWGYPVKVATVLGHIDVIRKLVDLGAGLNVVSDGGCETPLSFAARGSVYLTAEQNLAVVELLLELGADIELPRVDLYHRQTPLHIALYHKNVAIACTMLSRGANPNTQDNFGNDAFDYAAYFDLTKVIQLLLELLGPDGADRIASAVRSRDFVRAAETGDLEEVRRLLTKGANVNKIELHGKDALFFASDKNNLKLIRVLLENGGNPNNLIGTKTALMAAAYRGHREAFDLLLDAGADIFAECEMAPGVSENALEFALEGQHRDFAAYIKKEMKLRRPK